MMDTKTMLRVFQKHVQKHKWNLWNIYGIDPVTISATLSKKQNDN